MDTPNDDDTVPSRMAWAHVTRPLPVLRRAPRTALAAAAAAIALALAAVAYVIPARMVPYVSSPSSHTASGLIAVPGVAVTRIWPGAAVTMPGVTAPGGIITRAGPEVTRTAAGRPVTVTSALPGATATDTTTATDTMTATATETVPGPTVTDTVTATETVPGPTVTETVTARPSHGPHAPAAPSG